MPRMKTLLYQRQSRTEPISFDEGRIKGWGLAVKNLCDCFLALFFLCLVSPLMLIIALVVKLSSRGPALFKQKRNGLNGKVIEIYKFRSMYVRKTQQEGSLSEEIEKTQITPFGWFLRRTSLDELPQLFNVLEGKLSLVGPRPHSVYQTMAYRKSIAEYMVRHRVKPGITGWAQVHGHRGRRDLEAVQERVEYDKYYLNHWSLGFDLLILLKTPFAVWRQAFTTI